MRLRLGWNADYPDAENFLFLLYSKAGKTKFDGENTSNYDSAEYDRLFERQAVLPDGRLASASFDETVRIWETSGSGEPLILKGHENTVSVMTAPPKRAGRSSA